MATYAVIREDEIVFDIIEFDIFSGEQLPYMEVSIIKVGESTPTAIPTIGQKWDGEINQFIDP
jgi:hypothetical protein